MNYCRYDDLGMMRVMIRILASEKKLVILNKYNHYYMNHKKAKIRNKYRNKIIKLHKKVVKENSKRRLKKWKIWQQ